MRFFHFLSVAVLLCATGCAKVTTVRHHPECQSLLTHTKKVAVLPPIAEVNIVDAFNNKKRAYNYEFDLEHLIASEIVSSFKTKGFSVKMLHRKDLHDLGAYDSYLRLVDAYSAVRKELYKTFLWEEEKAFSIVHHLGEPVLDLGSKTDSDFIVMIDYEGAVKTNGARARDFLLGVLSNNLSSEVADGSMIVIGILDGKSGHVLWTNLSFDTRDLLQSSIDNLSSQKDADLKKLNRLITHTLTPLP